MLFFKAMLIGLCIAAPVGPIGMLCIQRSLQSGFRAGIATGLGAASADAFYGLLGALGCAALVSTFPRGAVAVKMAGGAFLIYLAVTMIRARHASPAAQGSSVATRRHFLSTFVLTLSNPLTILSFVAIFAGLGAAPGPATPSAYVLPVTMVCGVFLGSLAWWLCLSGVTSALRTRIPAALAAGVAACSGAAIGAFGIFQLVSGAAQLLARL